ncbi:MAG: NAD(P)/FAD-dependent oxidoreductase [Chlamydiales bacterium]|nr:NAD(P)/FAD-dependent oxidoreductase [Chlamydiales bacterium]
MMYTYDTIVVGGGAAGFFAAVTAQGLGSKVAILEKTRQPLAKVRISGGGRCNVTHSCFDPAQLVQHYPRGKDALRGPFTRFQPRDTIQWFADRGVHLKTEADGRMFPYTDSSQTIIDCLQNEATKTGVHIYLESDVEKIEKRDDGFIVFLANKKIMQSQKLILATGSNRKVYTWLETLGHTIIPCVPSLFTFNIANFTHKEIAGVSVPKAHVKVLGVEQTGPLLITHWGFSGPAVLKTSAWGARLLFDAGYKADVTINWLADLSYDAKQKALLDAKLEHPKKQIASICPFSLPQSLWKAMLTRSKIDPLKRFAELSKQELLSLLDCLHRDVYKIEGTTTNKEEFVTCGGVALDEVNFKTMESKKIPGLYFAGEVLDIDGVTGGFNFQNAWTTGWIAAHAV